MSCRPEHTHKRAHPLKLFTINASATVLSVAATSDMNFPAVEDLLHPPPQSPSLSFAIHCTHDAITTHFNTKQITSN